MGTRAQVQMVNSGVTLYQHWDGDTLEATVREALKRKERWNDKEYLARIIFCEMVKENLMDSTGFGIGVTPVHGDIEYLIKVDVDHQNVTVCDLNTGVNKGYTFETFIQNRV